MSTPAPALAPIPQEKIAEIIRTGSPAISESTGQMFAPAAPQPSPFVSVAMPVDGVTISGSKFYTVTQV